MFLLLLFGSPSLNTKQALNCLFRSVAAFGRGACFPLSELYLTPRGARKWNFKGKSSAKVPEGAGSRDAAAVLGAGRGEAAWAPAGTEGREEGRNSGTCWHVWAQPPVEAGKCGVLRSVYSGVDQQQCPGRVAEPCLLEAAQIPSDSSRGLCAQPGSRS